MEADLNELHSLANTTFQNVTNLTPSLRQMVANAKVYQKSVQSTCNVAVMFIESLSTVANAATFSEGATKKLGEVLVDIIDAFKEIENMKIELTKLFINEVIIPLESRAEIEIGNMKVTHKSYNSENKLQTELVEKAKISVTKTKKKSIKKKKSTKLEEKEKQNVQTLDEAEKKLRKIREEGLRKALIEERRVYCFVAERMCTYGRGMVIYNNRISRFINQKLPDWQSFISRPTELPQESEDIISNPTGYKMGTVRRKLTRAERKESMKRGKSFNSHFPTKYSTLDGRASRGGSRPSLSAVTVSSISNLSDGSTSTQPARKAPTTPGISDTHNESYPTPPISIADGDLHDSVSRGASPIPISTNFEQKPFETYVLAPSKDMTVLAANNATRSEYANVVVLNKPEDLSTTGRSHSFTIPKKEPMERKVSLNRTESSVTEVMKRHLPPSGSNEDDFAARLAIIQTQLSQKLNQPQTDPTSKSRLKALYDHLAQDASQLDFQKDDIIIPICEETSGWQYGENEKTKKSGWFPAAYTEEVLVSSSGETQVKHNTNTTGVVSHRRHKNSKGAPPPVAKKMSRANQRKVSVACGPLTTPSKSYIQESHDIGRRTSAGVLDVPHMTSSSSMPHMIHMLAEQKECNGHERKHSNSFQGLEFAHSKDSINSFDDSMDDESLPTSGENSPRKKSLRRSVTADNSFEDMPPPPPPPPPNYDDDVVMQIKTSNNTAIIENSSFNPLTFKASATVR